MVGRESDIAVEMGIIEDAARRLSVAGVRAGIGDGSGELAEVIGDWYVEVYRALRELGQEFGAGSVHAATELALAAFERGFMYPGQETLSFMRTVSAKIWSAHPHHIRSHDRSAQPRY